MALNLYSEQAITPFVNTLFNMGDVDEILANLGINRWDLRALEGDDEITAVCDTRREALIATPWRLEPGRGRSVTFIWEQLEPIIVNLLRGAWNAVPYGYAVQEVVYKKLADGKIGIDAVKEKPFEWFTITQNGELYYINYKSLPGELVDTQYKFLLSIHRGTYRKPMGEALFARLYWPWFFRVHGWKFWAKWLERFGTPFLLGKTDSNTQALSDALGKAINESTLAVGTAESVEIVGGNGSGANFESFESAIIKRIQRAVLGQTLTSDIGSSGSYAAAKVHNEVRDDRRKADIRMVSETIQTLVNALHYLNNFSGAPPRFIMQDESGLEEARAARDVQLVNAKILSLTPEYLLRVYDYEEGDFTIPAQQPVTPPQAQPAYIAAEHMCVELSDVAQFTPEQQVIENLADDMLANVKSPIATDLIASAIRAASDPEDLQNRLAIILRDADTKEFSAALERALFAADVLGYAHAE